LSIKVRLTIPAYPLERPMGSLEVCKYTFSKEGFQQRTTLKECDDLVVCSIHDSENGNDYHRKSSTYDMLDKVRLLQFIIQSNLDDPFFQSSANPSNDPSQPLIIQYTEHGGHRGYCLSFHRRRYNARNFVAPHRNGFFGADWKHCKNSDELIRHPSDEMVGTNMSWTAVGLCSSPPGLAKDMAMAFNNKGMGAACVNFCRCN
jgi:hypothetical protein